MPDRYIDNTVITAPVKVATVSNLCVSADIQLYLFLFIYHFIIHIPHNDVHLSALRQIAHVLGSFVVNIPYSKQLLTNY